MREKRARGTTDLITKYMYVFYEISDMTGEQSDRDR